MKITQLILAAMVSAAAVVRLFDLSNAGWIKIVGGIAFILLMITWGIDAWKKHKEIAD